jgi:outer membrane receptor for ferrienterochelin and colicin
MILKLNQLLLIAVFLCCSVLSFGQDKFTISGYIEDAATGEKLIGANVFDPISNKGTTSNTFGFYSLTLPKDSVYLSVSYIGYQTSYFRLELDKNIPLNVKLADGTQLDEIVVTAEQGERIEDRVQMSQIEVPIKQIQKLPALLGEVDILKTLQLLPGVQSGGEGTSGLYVRGGSPDQNLILLDGVPVYNVSHLFGFFSVFNADAIKSVTLTKGGFPARYGGRLSSVLEINMKEGNMKEFKGEGAIGTVFSKLTLEGPIIKDKTSFIVSARRTYIDALAAPFVAASLATQNIDADIDVYFYDLNAKINHKFSEKDRLYLSAYLGNDVFRTTFKEDLREQGGFTTTAGLDWGNITSAARWNRMWNNKLFSNTTATYSRYKFNTGFGFEQIDALASGGVERTAAAFEYISGIEDVAAKIDFDYIPNPDHYIRFGTGITQHDFTPGVTQTKITIGALDTALNTGSQDTRAYEFALYVEDDMKIGTNFQANVGVHVSAFNVEGKTYLSAQPRLGLLYRLPNNYSLKASFATMTQFIHLLTNEGLGLPTDLWVPTTKKIVPEQSWQTGIGIAKTFNNMFEVSIEAYYKDMKNLVSYVEGASFISIDGEETGWESRVTQGNGKSYGAEFFLQKKSGDFTGWIGYTLAWTNRQFDDINGGEVYPFKYDRRHDLSIVLAYEFTERISASVVWVYGTGNAITLPEYRQNAYYPSADPNSFAPYWSAPVERAEAKNSFRMDAYHRLDFSVDFHKKRKYWEETIVIGAYNAYSRVNPFFINDEFRFGERKFVQYGLFPIIPALSYRFKF